MSYRNKGNGNSIQLGTFASSTILPILFFFFCLIIMFFMRSQGYFVAYSKEHTMQIRDFKLANMDFSDDRVDL